MECRLRTFFFSYCFCRLEVRQKISITQSSLNCAVSSMNNAFSRVVKMWCSPTSKVSIGDACGQRRHSAHSQKYSTHFNVSTESCQRFHTLSFHVQWIWLVWGRVEVMRHAFINKERWRRCPQIRRRLEIACFISVMDVIWRLTCKVWLKGF